ncbi:MAG: alkaline phosphatase family protein, partial [Planctomycetota bacterium]
MDRRRFLGSALGAGGAAALGGAWAALLDGGCAPTSGVPASRPLPAPEGRKLIIVQFGGGTRSSEAIDDPAHRFIPRLWNEMAPRGTLFTNMRVEGKVVHPNSTGSIMTGHWEYDDIDWSKPVAHPTVFEICRRARGAPDTSAWAFVYASILAKTTESTAAGYGREFAANVVEPPTIPRSTAEEVSRLMAHAAASGSLQMEIDASAEAARLARSTSRIARGGLRSEAARAFLDREYASWRAGDGTTSHDAFLTDRALACMRDFAPDVTAIGYGEIDCAHYGSWSRYVDAIRRTDELTWRVFRAAQELPAYRGRTLLLVLPDHGRELERPGGWGFIHHSDFYTDEGADEGCRRVWMLALGPGVAAGRTIDDAVPITAAASTGLDFLGLPTSSGAAG